VSVDDALHRRQADTRTLELPIRAQPLEGAEELVGILHVESDSVVGHVVRGVGVVVRSRVAADLDSRGSASRGELPGVAE